MRRALHIVIVVAVLLSLIACPGPKRQGAVRLGYLPIGECTPLFVGQSEKIFEKQGINVSLTEFDSGPTVIAASLGGSLDGGLAGVTPIFFALDKDKPIKMVSDGGHITPADHPYIGIVVAADSEIRTVNDLRGKKVAVNGLKTIEDALLRVALNEANIADGANVVSLPHPSMLRALRDKRIDAAMAIEPYIAMGLATGQARVLVGSEDIVPSFQLSAVFFTDDFIANNPDTLRKFMTAYGEAIDFIKTNPVRSKEIVAQWTRTPAETVRTMTLPGWSKNLDIDGLRKAQSAMVRNGILERSVDIEKFVYVPGQR